MQFYRPHYINVDSNFHICHSTYINYELYGKIKLSNEPVASYMMGLQFQVGVGTFVSIITSRPAYNPSSAGSLPRGSPT
jgi:hypothetical protein